MNERLEELKRKAVAEADTSHIDFDNMSHTEIQMLGDIAVERKFAELLIRECAKELREAEQEADRAYKAKEVKERNTFDGYDFADMLEERFGVE